MKRKWHPQLPLMLPFNTPNSKYIHIYSFVFFCQFNVNLTFFFYFLLNEKYIFLLIANENDIVLFFFKLLLFVLPCILWMIFVFLLHFVVIKHIIFRNSLWAQNDFQWIINDCCFFKNFLTQETKKEFILIAYDIFCKVINKIIRHFYNK